MACNLLETRMERSGNLLRVDASTAEGVAAQVAAAYTHVRKLLATEQREMREKQKPVRTGAAVARVIKAGGGGSGGGGEDASVEERREDPARDALPLRRSTPLITPLRTPVGMVLEADSFALIQASVRTAAAGQAAVHSSLVLRQFLFVALHVKSLVACRCQPSTKSSIVHLLKEAQSGTTLAIGDGANDEQMIRTAHVGVGIRGVEGTTAVQASDYSISQFHFLRRLLFTHGRLSLRRVSLLICQWDHWHSSGAMLSVE